MKFEEHVVLIKLICRRCYHSECLNDYVLAASNPQCPVCAGPCKIGDRFRYDPPAREESFSSAHDPLDSATSAAYPWFTAPTEQPAGYFYAKTELPSGRPAALVDPGAWTSAGGQEKSRALATIAAQHGYQLSQRKMDTPLKISGVGEGVQECKWETTTPVAIPTEDGTAAPFDLQMPIVTGSGSHLPIIVGLKTMSAKNGVLEMGKGKEFLTFPGPGGYKLEFAPGAIRMPLERASSGHLMLPLAEYDKLPKAGGIQKEDSVLTLHALQQDDPGREKAEGALCPGVAAQSAHSDDGSPSLSS